MRKYLLPEKGKFYKVNMHSHSTLSDGRQTPEELKEAYLKKGYSAIAFTEHGELHDLNHLTDENFIAIKSYEIDFRQQAHPAFSAYEGEAMLNEHRLPFERLEMRLADLWPKQWFTAFVPEDRRKEAKKQCFSGRRHVGFLWQAFSMGFVEAMEGDAAWDGWFENVPETCMLCLPDDGLLFRVKGIIPTDLIRELGYCVIADEGMMRTFMYTGRKDKGPYYKR
jgi:hypothetical protein